MVNLLWTNPWTLHPEWIVLQYESDPEILDGLISFRPRCRICITGIMAPLNLTKPTNVVLEMSGQPRTRTGPFNTSRHRTSPDCPSLPTLPANARRPASTPASSTGWFNRIWTRIDSFLIISDQTKDLKDTLSAQNFARNFGFLSRLALCYGWMMAFSGVFYAPSL